MATPLLADDHARRPQHLRVEPVAALERLDHGARLDAVVAGLGRDRLV
jgi:hypothetical protein